MSKFKVGDKIVCKDNSGGREFIVGNVYTVKELRPDCFEGADLVKVEEITTGQYDYRFDLYVEEPVCTAPSDEYVQESYNFTYTAMTDSGTDTSTSTLYGDKAGDIVEVLNVLRGFLQRSGFNWVAEVNAVTEDGTWHSSNGKVG